MSEQRRERPLVEYFNGYEVLEGLRDFKILMADETAIGGFRSVKEARQFANSLPPVSISRKLDC